MGEALQTAMFASMWYKNTKSCDTPQAHSDWLGKCNKGKGVHPKNKHCGVSVKITD